MTATDLRGLMGDPAPQKAIGKRIAEIANPPDAIACGIALAIG